MSLDPSIQAVFDPKKNEMFSDGEAIRWIARDKKGEVVGRIAAFYDREHAFLEEQPTGGCGFFEAINDQELADQLFDAARMWLSSRGMEAMDGPINFGPRDSWWGLLVSGYEFQPSMRTRTIRLIIKSCSRITDSRTTSTSIPICVGWRWGS